ncbi:alpha/beta hydrolase [Streptomyces sp. NBC_01408]|uniref:alpha/beta hydrolase n=1 Tax=Streptomyces sp. NBC_01408 TaxID=2903855 RepID=UPI0022591F31|nr:alpha/beta hydrolase [Streptomyces sp. NBC_01408]MCX4695626.1 alpha/beta hydrolase [Streptomyces sp. NBC_01408]
MPMDPEIGALLKQFGVDGPPPATPPTVAEMRAGNRMLSLAVAPDPPIEVGSAEDDTVAGVPVRVYRPAGHGLVPTVVFFHGGGFIVGDLDTHDGVCRRLCRDLGAVVVSVGYRLAPEFPFPAGYDDCVAVTTHVAGHPEDYGGGGLAVAGDSAGGGLAAGVALAFRDEGRPLTAQLLAYPSTDLSGQGGHRSLVENATGYLLTTAEVENDARLYLADDPGAAARAPASPLLADSHTGLAPAVIGCGECDPLRDEGLAYADALAAAGVPVRKHMYPGLIHGFISFDTKSTVVDAAVTEMLTEFRELLATPYDTP